MSPQRNVKLKSALFASGLTQRELSQRSNVPESYISLSVQGKYVLASDQQERIASVLGVKIEEVFRRGER